ncbi:MAG: PhnD/SsuA/transferrin family substrate-binding protein [Pseudomonadota bacterium]
MDRRHFLGLLATAAAGRVWATPEPIRVGLTPVFLDDQVAFLNRWRDYLELRLARPVEFVQRGSYREIMDLLRGDKLDVAWVCGYPYVRNRRALRLMAVPLFNGRPLYQSYLIVPASDGVTRSLLDLRGKVFAFSDPDSNSGYLYPTYRLLQANERNDTFFGKSFFTWAHRKVVEAVAARVANGGAVDSYVWETLARFHPTLTDKTRIVEKSPEFGHTPFGARATLPRATFAAFQQSLLRMGDDPDGRALLGQLNLDGFVPGQEALFDGIEQMAKAVAAPRHARSA